MLEMGPAVGRLSLGWGKSVWPEWPCFLRWDCGPSKSVMVLIWIKENLYSIHIDLTLKFENSVSSSYINIP